jgi:hypothetical protein
MTTKRLEAIAEAVIEGSIRFDEVQAPSYPPGACLSVGLLGIPHVKTEKSTQGHIHL